MSTFDSYRIGRAEIIIPNLQKRELRHKWICPNHYRNARFLSWSP